MLTSNSGTEAITKKYTNRFTYDGTYIESFGTKIKFYIESNYLTLFNVSSPINHPLGLLFGFGKCTVVLLLKLSKWLLWNLFLS
ncbi:unnamed protein product [Schistosoma turkestanicum]|nr:unnamed protein product [Schistosoma turkestanicum]